MSEKSFYPESGNEVLTGKEILQRLNEIFEARKTNPSIHAGLAGSMELTASQIARILHQDVNIVLEALQKLPEIGKIESATTPVDIQKLIDASAALNVQPKKKSRKIAQRDLVDFWTNHLVDFINQHPEGISAHIIADQFNKPVRGVMNRLKVLVREGRISKRDSGEGDDRAVKYFPNQSTKLPS